MDNVKCKGTWRIEDELQSHDFICPLRVSCFRYQSRFQSQLVIYFEKVPISIDGQNCKEYIKWGDLKEEKC